MKLIAIAIMLLIPAQLCLGAVSDVQADDTADDSRDILCGDVNGDGVTYTVGDLVHLARYITGTAPAIAPLENSDVDLCGSVNISDLALYTQFFVYGIMVGICQPTDECYLPTGTNEVNLGCPIEMPIVSTDSFPLPIYITNDDDLAAFSIGLHYNSDDVEFSSLDMTGSVLSSNWWVLVTTPSDTDYVHSVPDSNMVFLVGYAEIPEIEAVPPQENGLLAILWFDVKPGALAQVINFEPVFFPPAGEFLFSPIGKGSIVPAYDDCGAQDVILFDYICGDANESDQVDIDDAVFMLQCIFVDCLGIPLERLDVTCDGVLDIDDVVHVIAYIFAGGPQPCDIDGDGEPDC